MTSTINNKQLTINNGISLIEILVVITVFAVLGILSTRAILLTLRGTNKSSATQRVRENLAYSLSIMERQLRNAQSVSPCPNAGDFINYTDVNGQSSFFRCVPHATTGYIASGSANLTSDEITITSCTIVCSAGVTGLPDLITVSATAEDKNTVGVESAKATVNTQILLRTY